METIDKIKCVSDKTSQVWNLILVPVTEQQRPDESDESLNRLWRPVPQVEWPAGGRPFLLPSPAGGGRGSLCLHELRRRVWLWTQCGAERTGPICVRYDCRCCGRLEPRWLPGWGFDVTLTMLWCSCLLITDRLCFRFCRWSSVLWNRKCDDLDRE